MIGDNTNIGRRQSPTSWTRWTSWTFYGLHAKLAKEQRRKGRETQRHEVFFKAYELVKLLTYCKGWKSTTPSWTNCNNSLRELFLKHKDTRHKDTKAQRHKDSVLKTNRFFIYFYTLGDFKSACLVGQFYCPANFFYNLHSAPCSTISSAPLK